MIDGLTGSRRPLFLASVRSAEEASMALSGGADVIDCKNPEKGALGALEASEIASICNAVGGRARVSATVGDLPADAPLMVKEATSIAAAGADIVKVGFFGDGDARKAIAALGAAPLGAARLVAVLMADCKPNLGLIGDLARAGFIGVMLDTAEKAAGALPDVMQAHVIASFVRVARGEGLMTGLAGSLRRSHIREIVALDPDLIGFRGALCLGSRKGELDQGRVAAVRADLDAAIAERRALERSVA